MNEVTLKFLLEENAKRAEHIAGLARVIKDLEERISKLENK